MSRVAILAGVAALALLRGEKDSLPPDLAYVPGKAFLTVSLRPADVWEHELSKGLHGKLGKEADDLAKGVTKEVGLPMAALERVTFVVNQLGPMTQGVHPLMFVAS